MYPKTHDNLRGDIFKHRSYLPPGRGATSATIRSGADAIKDELGHYAKLRPKQSTLELTFLVLVPPVKVTPVYFYNLSRLSVGEVCNTTQKENMLRGQYGT